MHKLPSVNVDLICCLAGFYKKNELTGETCDAVWCSTSAHASEGEVKFSGGHVPGTVSRVASSSLLTSFSHVRHDEFLEDLAKSKSTLQRRRLICTAECARHPEKRRTANHGGRSCEAASDSKQRTLVAFCKRFGHGAHVHLDRSPCPGVSSNFPTSRTHVPHSRKSSRSPRT